LRAFCAHALRTEAPMPTGPAILVHPASRRRERPSLAVRAATLLGHFVFAAALIVGGSVALAMVLTLVFVAAPLAAGLVLWMIWRSGDAAARQTRRVRARVQRRARSLGLSVLAGAQPAAMLRLATAGARERPRSPRAASS